MSVLTPPTQVADLNTGKHSRTVVPLNSFEDITRATDTLCKAFADSAANDYLLRKFFNISLREPVSRCRFNAIISYYTAWYHDLGGEIVEANDFDAVGIWSLPGRHLPHTLSNDPQFNKLFFDDLDERRYQVLPEGMDCYYLFMIGKDPSQQHVRGSVRQILGDYKQRADADNCACVLEAISEHARSVYEYFGFKVFKEFKFGVGEVDSQGQVDSQGSGFTAYLMIYYKDPQVLNG
ncbi:YOR012W [Zygosaccharomyces parabailii]|nr:YOR012W [Zygosaccharomyces parabailii]CDH12311.1 related to IRC11-Strong similarity to YDR391c [Zygosaccharomyces bailii ISA1307]